MMNPLNIRYSVIGAGNGGLAMAGYLAKQGYCVNLYNRTREKILPLINKPIINLTGSITGSGKLNMVTSDIEKAIANTDIIMVTIPAIGHYQIAKAMVPYLQDGQIIVLNPGRTGGALEVYETIKMCGCNKNVIVAEAQTFIYACRAIDINNVHVFSVKKDVSLAAIPAVYTNKVVNLLSGAYPQFTPARDVIETSLNNFGAVFHPTPTLLNSGLIERGQPFEYYIEGITPSIAQMLEKIDEERLKVARMLEVKEVTALEWLQESYYTKGNNIYEALQNNPAYKGLKAPNNLNTRYIYEDIPCSLVPISSIAKNLGIDTPAIDTIINLAEMLTGRNFTEEGRTVEKLGLKGLNAMEIRQFAQTGCIEDEITEEVVA